MHKILKIFWKSLNKKFKLYFLISIFFSIISSISEMLTIGSFLPLVTLVLSPETSDNSILNFLLSINNKLSLGFENNLIYYFSIIFLFFVALSTITRVVVLWWNANFVKKLSVEFSSLILSDLLGNNYSNVLGKDQNKIFSIFLNKIDRFIDFIQHYISIISNFIISIAIIVSLLLVDHIITVLILIFFGTFYSILIYFIKSKTNKVSKIISYNLDKRVNSIKDSLIYLRQILLSNSQNFFINNFRNFETNIRETTKKMYIYYSFPKIFLEAIAIFVIIFIAFFLLNVLNLDRIYIISVLAVVAYASQKLLVYFNQIYHSLTVLNSLRDVSLDVINEINAKKITKKLSKNKKLFWKTVQFKKISFSYDKKAILNNISFKIQNNKFIGIKGKTGSGKTTLLDIISLLLNPSKGSILIDGKNIFKYKKQWQNKIAYVPQNIYLSETSVLKNIVIDDNIENIDKEKLRKVLKISCCEDFINFNNLFSKSEKRKLTRLSGGQTQRLGIARALYQSPEILLLDEATNALDGATEKKLMSNLKENFKNKCVIIISHKQLTLKYCDLILNVK